MWLVCRAIDLSRCTLVLIVFDSGRDACAYTVVSWVRFKHNSRFWPAWVLARDQNS